MTMATRIDLNLNGSHGDHLSLIEIGNAPITDSPASDASDTMEIPAAPADDDDDSEISAPAAELCAAETAIARKHGFKHATDELLFTAGTKLWDVGTDTAKRYAAEYDALPLLTDAAERHAARIESELRRDYVIKPAEWYLDGKGLLACTDGDARKVLEIPDHAWNQIAARQLKIPHPTDEDFKPHEDPAVNAANTAAREAKTANFNKWLPRVPGTAKMRVRSHRGRREILALVSSSSRGYTTYDSHRVLADIAAVMPPDMRADVHYNSDTTQLRADMFVMAPVDVDALNGVGRTHKVGITLRTGDRGLDALTARAFLQRARCRNFTLVREEIGALHRKHVGSYKALVSGVRALVGRIPEMIEELRSLWAHAAAEQYRDEETGLALSVPETIARLVAANLIPRADKTAQEAIDAYVAAWRAEGEGSSAAHVIAAVQRAAHETTWRTRWADDEIESKASDMLYQQVFALAAPDVAPAGN